jgi:hypothetical protein
MRDILIRMALMLHRHTRGRFFAFPLALLLALHSASPCLALCSAVRAESVSVVAATETNVPACHASKSAPVQSDFPLGNTTRMSGIELPGCCCVEDASARTQGESPSTPIARTGSTCSHEFAVSASELSAPRLHSVVTAPGIHGDLSPPHSPLFIAHHSLLI